MKCLLLGGSNSVLKHSIQGGFSNHFEVLNLSLGATSCIQNILELSKNENLVASSDLIVTESNVNDIMAYVSLGLSPIRIEHQINELYRLLNNTGKPVISLVLPTHPNQEKEDDIKFINSIHIKNCQKYNFHYVHLEDVLREMNVEQKNHLMPHPRHFNEAYINQMCSNVATYFLRFSERFVNLIPKIYDGPSYRFIGPDDFVGGQISVFDKSNSVFTTKVFSFEEGVNFSEKFYGFELVALSAWCDGYSSVKLVSDDVEVIKNFKSLYTCSELVESMKISENTRVELNFKNVPPTENTLLVKFEADTKINTLLLEGFLICDNTVKASVPDVSAIRSLDYLDISQFVRPNWRPFAAAAKTLVTQLK